MWRAIDGASGGVQTLKTQDTLDPRHFRPRTLQQFSTSALLYEKYQSLASEN